MIKDLANITEKKNECTYSVGLKKILKLLPVFNPDHYLIIFWDFIILVLAFLNLIFSPLYFCFKVSDGYSELVVVCMPIFFLLDMLITLNRGFYENFCKIYARKKLVLHFIKTQLICDLAPTLQLLLIR